MKTLAKKLMSMVSTTVSALGKVAEYILFGIIGVSFAFLMLSLNTGTTYPSKDKDLASTSAKIVRLDGRSGGSGVILKSTKTVSYVLTNAHVCGVVENGGLVVTDRSSYTVTTYKKSKMHDLCLLTVAGDLGVNTEISTEAPGMYSEAIAAGHPNLLPTVITRGHFSGYEVISVMIGARPCTEEDLEDDPDNALLCAFVGGIPLIQTFHSQVASVLISPGSSGSPVFDGAGRISGLVFAGAGEIGQAFIVPQEAVYNFVYLEAPRMAATQPNYTLEITAKMLKGKSLGHFEVSERIDLLCEQDIKGNKAAQKLCDMHKRDLIWRK